MPDFLECRRSANFEDDRLPDPWDEIDKGEHVLTIAADDDRPETLAARFFRLVQAGILTAETASFSRQHGFAQQETPAGTGVDSLARSGRITLLNEDGHTGCILSRGAGGALWESGSQRAGHWSQRRLGVQTPIRRSQVQGRRIDASSRAPQALLTPGSGGAGEGSHPPILSSATGLRSPAGPGGA
jgi:hypothetical protein